MTLSDLKVIPLLQAFEVRYFVFVVHSTVPLHLDSFLSALNHDTLLLSHWGQ